MDSFEFNKIAGAVLGTGLFVLVVTTLSEGIFETEAPETPVYLASLATEDGGAEHGAAGGGEPAEETISAMLASADAGAGEKVAKKCVSCHTFENGGANKVGPNLWNIVNKAVASADGFGYSPAMTEFAAGGKVWDYDHLNEFLTKPKAVVDGTKMTFGGLSKGSDRADLIAYLRSLSDSPAPLPAKADSADAGMATETAAAEPASETASDAAPSTAMSAPASSENTMAAATDKPAEDTMAAAETPAADSAPAAESAPAADETPKTEMAAAGTESPAAGDDNVLAMIAGEDPASGEKVAKKCKACHNFDEGAKNKIGPVLWNIVNRPVASVADFKYSDAMKTHGEGGTTWTYAELDAFLVKPKEHIPGTKMVFAGLRKESDRAAILAYLRTLSSDPAPLP